MSTAFNSLPTETLTPSDEAVLANDIAKWKREEDITKLVMANMREAVIYARKCCRETLDDGILISLCYRALMANAPRFKPGFRVRFLAFAKAGLRGELKHYWETLEPVRNARKHETEPDLMDPQPLEPDSCSMDFNQIFSHEDWENVQKIINRRCTKQERMILDLVYQKHLSFQDVGRLLGVSRSAVQANHGKALRKVRNGVMENRRLFTG